MREQPASSRSDLDLAPEHASLTGLEMSGADKLPRRPRAHKTDMKVLLVYTGLTPGGITTDLRNLERGLQERGVEVAVAGDLREVCRQVRGGNVLVHLFSCLPTGTTFGTMALARAHRLPLVWTPVFYPSRIRSWEGSGLLRVMELFDRLAPRVGRFVDGLIAATDGEAEHFERLGAHRIEVIPPAVDKTIGRAQPEARTSARDSFGLQDEPTVLLVARGNASRHKGFPFAVAAFRKLRERLPEARLLLVGPEPGDELARETNAIATGWCGPARVAEAYDAADVLLVSSIYEGLPRAVIEAWSHELPVAVTDRIALASLVRDRAGKVAPFGDVTAMAEALEIILTDNVLARQYGNTGRALVDDHFLLADHVDRTIVLYHSIEAHESR